MPPAGDSIKPSLTGERAAASRSARTGKFRGIYHSPMKIVCVTLLLSTSLTIPLYAQAPLEESQLESSQNSSPQPQTGRDRSDPQAAGPSGDASQDNSQAEGKQPKRILWVIPNYRAVSANTHLPPLGRKEKLWLATEDSFDYSAFVLAGIVAGISQAQTSTPEFHDGAAAYGRYYWHTFTDEAVGNYFTEALLPIVTRQDPRYYTLGPSGGGFWRRTRYSLTRLLITRTDSGRNTFNTSEIIGNAAGATLSDLYYPRPERTWGKTGEKWLLQLGIDGFFDMAKEFWPDIDQRVFHGHYGSGRL
jgi:hypothetical protein